MLFTMLFVSQKFDKDTVLQKKRVILSNT